MKKVAIVTGARRGIGLAIARKMLSEGYLTVLCAVTPETEVTSLMEELNQLGEAYYYTCDISSAENRGASAGYRAGTVRTNRCTGQQRRRCLQSPAEYPRNNPESFERLMKVNCEGTFFMCQGAANRMIACQKKQLPDYTPRIVNISSISAYTSSTSRGEYCISKAGISMVTPAVCR